MVWVPLDCFDCATIYMFKKHHKNIEAINKLGES